MSTSNVVEFAEAKRTLLLKQKEKQFKNYLSSLKQDQLQIEANFLMNKVGNDLNDEALMKSALLMEELAKRVSSDNISNSIHKFAGDIREKLRSDADEKPTLQ